MSPRAGSALRSKERMLKAASLLALPTTQYPLYVLPLPFGDALVELLVSVSRPSQSLGLFSFLTRLTMIRRNAAGSSSASRLITSRPCRL